MASNDKTLIFGHPLSTYFWCFLIFIGISQLLGAFAALGGLRDDYVAGIAGAEKVDADSVAGLTPRKYYFVSGPAFSKDEKETTGMIYYSEQTKGYSSKSSWVSGESRIANFFIGARKKILAVRHDAYSDSLMNSEINDCWKHETFDVPSRSVRVRRKGFSPGQKISVWGRAMDEKTIDAEIIISCSPDEYIGSVTKKLADEKRSAPFLIVIGIALIVFGAKKLRAD